MRLPTSVRIRKASSTIIAKSDELKELVSLTATVPFDDRVNHQASLQDLNLTLIQSFLFNVGSKLLEESHEISFVDLCRQMAIIDGGNEYLKPRNVGLLYFSTQPEKFFPYAQIDVVYFPEGAGGNQIYEEIFRGPLDHQLRSALLHIRNGFIKEQIIKIPGQAEARRFFNYPYEAIEEALVNAVYHRSYEIREPIEVRINPDKIEILSFPGPEPSVSLEALKKERIVSRRYRNRRVGELLKELKFTEGRSTGVPKIYRSLAQNGSPPPRFETNEERTYFLIEISIHPEMLPSVTQKKGIDGVTDWVIDKATDNTTTFSDTELKILRLCLQKPVGRTEILEVLGNRVFSRNIRQALKQLRVEGLIDHTIADKPSSKYQRYRITEKGKRAAKNYG